MAGNFVQLTRAKQSPIWINGAAVTAIRGLLPNEFVAAIQSVITVGALSLGLTESPDGAKSAPRAG
jgi:hypothetical protein